MDTIIATNTGEQLNFIDLFRSKNYSIEIPIIQRDYAQGRISKEKIRNGFLDSLYDCLTNDKKTDLDFVYGNVSGTKNTLSKFIPLDGQQRLTTLFLLHWYLAHKDKQEGDFKRYLLFEDKSRFTYETRTSTREFCNSLVQNGIDLDNLLTNDDELGNSITKTIQNSNWYFLSWNNDPTIKGMLLMLDSIHNKFNDTNGYYEKLVKEDNPIITFQFLNLQDLQMTDDLYIKMNARGKALTDFENFKAQFEKHLEINHPNLRSEFSNKIDGIWCDMFWNYSINHPQKQHNKIDQQFINYFYFISEMLFYKDRVEDTEYYDFSNFKLIESIYTSTDNIVFLMKSLDLFSNKSKLDSKQTINNFFDELFSKTYHENKISLFGGSINLFENLVYSGSFGHQDKLMLYVIINYFISADALELDVNDNLKNYLRVCRNFILKVNQKGNSNSKDEFVPDLRTSFYKDIIQTLSLVYDKNDVYTSLKSKEDSFKFRKDNIQGEIFKAEIISSNNKLVTYIHKLEDHPYIKTDLRNFELLISDEGNLKNLATQFYEIFGVVENDLIVRSLLAIDDYSVWVGNCYFGGLYFFGKNEKWHRILTDKDNSTKLKTILESYFTKLKANASLPLTERLNKIISEGLLKSEQPKWMELFLKYPVITKTSHSIYSFEDKDTDYKIERIDGTSLRHYHINVFVNAVLNSENITAKINKEQGAKDGVETFIVLKENIYLLPDDDYWIINAQNIDISKLKTPFSLEQIDDKNEFRLFPTDKLDYVEVVVDFINKLYELK